jgi:hypothetical protein
MTMKVELQARDANDELINSKTGNPSGKSFAVEDHPHNWFHMGNSIQACLEGFRTYSKYETTTYVVSVTFDQKDVLEILRQAIAAGMLPELQALQQVKAKFNALQQVKARLNALREVTAQVNERLEECESPLAQINDWFSTLAGKTTT